MWTRYKELYFNISSQSGSPLVAGVSNPQVIDSVEYVTGDTFPVRLYFLRETGNQLAPFSVEELIEDDVLILAGKRADSLGEETLLTRTIVWERGEDPAGHPYWEGILNGDTPELKAVAAGLSGTTKTFLETIDLEVEDADNTQRATFQFSIVWKREAYLGTESDPSPATPIFPLPENILVKAGNLAGLTDPAAARANLGISTRLVRVDVPADSTVLPDWGDDGFDAEAVYKAFGTAAEYTYTGTDTVPAWLMIPGANAF